MNHNRKMKTTQKIEGPIFIGRSYAEYLKFFNLDGNYLENRSVLDCAAGASSFTSHMNQLGYDSQAVDILYGEEAQLLAKRCMEHLNILVDAISPLEDHFKWDFFRDVEGLRKHRCRACRDFINDYQKNKNNSYIKADITRLPFKDNSFDLVLCSHLLFIYDHRLNYEFHLKSVQEMMRVAREEVRLYPLVKHKKKKSGFVEKIINELSPRADIRLVEVDYEFRRGGNQMMQIITARN